MNQWIEHYKCQDCGCEWSHHWDDDPNNDFTQCPSCQGFDFDEVEEIK